MAMVNKHRLHVILLALMPMLGVAIVLLLILVGIYQGNTVNVLASLSGYTSRLLTGTIGYSGIEGGFLINIAISILSMSIALVVGCVVGLCMLSQNMGIRVCATVLMNGLRNSPWLVILYAMLYLLPFRIEIMGDTYVFSPFLKATIGLSLPVMANLAEIVRGSVETIHVGQWESARSLGYRPAQVFWIVILPQAIPRMIPNVMNIYAMLVIGSSLVVVTGTHDVLAITKVIGATAGENVVSGLYIYVLFLFFLYCFPIATLSRWYERRLLEAAT